jgi:hypothetical protein
MIKESKENEMIDRKPKMDKTNDKPEEEDSQGNSYMDQKDH